MQQCKIAGREFILVDSDGLCKYLHRYGLRVPRSGQVLSLLGIRKQAKNVYSSRGLEVTLVKGGEG